ncbi:MAG TPA: AbrB family transcriptional regulator [Clostridiales bacterium]|nr:AbrB family transcriptional regulator [Clostridiales bacterium]
MKTSGIIRHIDELGRIVIPKEMRRTLEIAAEDPVEITMEGDSIRLRKYQTSCVFCGSSEELSEFKGKTLCRACREELANADAE